MLKSVKKGITLLIKGPTCVTLQKGEAEVLAAPLPIGKKLIVRKGRSLPFEVIEDSDFEVAFGVDAKIDEISGSTIPISWRDTTIKLTLNEVSNKVLVLGTSDIGKTTFCTYLANTALANTFEVNVIDGDLGQSDIGPPTTISSSRLTKPVADLFNVEPVNIFFTGITTPSRAPDRVLKGFAFLNESCKEETGSFTIINTDGWITGEDAIHYKMNLISELCPETVIGIQESEELENILQIVEKQSFNVIRLERPNHIKKRDRNERKYLREQGYHKFLKGIVTRSIPMSWIHLDNTPLSRGETPTVERLKELENLFSCQIIYCEESTDTIFIVFGRETPDDEISSKVLDVLNKRLFSVFRGEEKGLLVGISDERGMFLGIGVIQEIDYGNQVIKVHTPVEDQIGYIHFGQVIVNKYGKELGVNSSFSL